MDKKKMRLLYVNRFINFQDGSGVHAREFARAFSKLAHLLTFPVLKPKPDNSWHRQPQIPSLFGRPINHWIPTPFEIFILARELRRSLQDVLKICRQVHTFHPQAVIVRQQGVDFVAPILAKLLPVPVLLEVNAPIAIEVGQERPRGILDIYARSERFAWRSVKSVLVVSKVLKEILINARISPERIHVNPNGVDVNLFNPLRFQREQSRERLGLPSSKPIIGFTGSLRPWHGLRQLLSAFDSLRAVNQDVCLMLVGDGPERTNIETWITERSLSHKVFMPGLIPHDNLPTYLAAMDICVAPYPAINPFYFSPIKVIEYMAMAKPIVASNIGQINELLADSAGLLVPPGDADKLAEKLLELLECPDSRTTFGTKARNKVITNYTWDHNAQRVKTALDSLLN